MKMVQNDCTREAYLWRFLSVSSISIFRGTINNPPSPNPPLCRIQFTVVHVLLNTANSRSPRPLPCADSPTSTPYTHTPSLLHFEHQTGPCTLVWRPWSDPMLPILFLVYVYACCELEVPCSSNLNSHSPFSKLVGGGYVGEIVQVKVSTGG